MTLLSQALKIRTIIEKVAVNLTDKDASIAPILFPSLKNNNTLIKAGTRICWQGKIKKAAVDLWDREDMNPINAPALWVDILYKDGERIIPGNITVAEAFSKEELGWWKNKLYKSLIDNNVYTPDQDSSNWEILENKELEV